MREGRNGRPGDTVTADEGSSGAAVHALRAGERE